MTRSGACIRLAWGNRNAPKAAACVFRGERLVRGQAKRRAIPVKLQARAGGRVGMCTVPLLEQETKEHHKH